MRIGRYEILNEIGRGGMAVVYRARDPNFNRDVAVKVLPRELLHDPNFKARFQREAQTIAGLEHPAIVPVHDFGEEDGQPYLVMRYMPGGSLADRLKLGPVGLTEALRIVGQLAPALDRAHLAGIVHRDLKPANILFDREDNAYIADFGLAKIANADVNLSATAVYGTPAYMSPEQAKGVKEIDGRADLYALGVVAYQMLAGRVPYEADTPIALALKHVMEPAPRLRDARPDLPEQADRVLQRAMAKDPRDRFATASHLHAALVASLQTSPQRPVATDPEAPTIPEFPTPAAAQAKAGAAVSSPPANNTTMWLVGCVVVGLILVVGAAAAVGGGLLISRGLVAGATATSPPATATAVAVAPSTPTTAAQPPTATPRPSTPTAASATPTAAAPSLDGVRVIGQAALDSDAGLAYVFAYPSGSGELSLLAIDLDQRVALWRQPIGEYNTELRFAAGPGVLALVDGKSLTVLDARSGEARWRAVLSDVLTTCLRPSCLAVIDDRVVIATLDRQVTAFDTASGEVVWGFTLATDGYGFDLIGGQVVVINEPEDQDAELVFLDPAIGAERRATSICRAGSLPDDVNHNARFTTQAAGEDAYIVFGFFGTCLARFDPASASGALTTAGVVDVGGLDYSPVAIGAEGVYVEIDGAIYAADAGLTRAARRLLASDDADFHLVAATEGGLLVVRTDQVGTPDSWLELVDPADGSTTWSVELGQSQLLAAFDSFSLDDGASYVDVIPSAPGQVLLLTYGVATEPGGASRLAAETVTLADGAVRPVGQTVFAGSTVTAKPVRLSETSAEVWLHVGVGLVRLDVVGGAFDVVIQP